jgi:sulfur relay (sulfurtransferase) DsrF/TusC family protein
MDKKIIIKLDTRPNNKSLLHKIMQYLVEHEMAYEIMRRPIQSKALESFDGLLMIHHADYQLEEVIHEYTEVFKANIQMIVYQGDETHQHEFVEGSLSKTVKVNEDLQPGSLENEVLFVSGDLYTHLAEKPSFIESADFEIVHSYLSRYDFLRVDYSSHVITMREKCCLDYSTKQRFVHDMNLVQAILSEHELSLYCNLVGIDCNMNLEKISMDQGKLNTHYYS